MLEVAKAEAEAWRKAQELLQEQQHSHVAGTEEEERRRANQGEVTKTACFVDPETAARRAQLVPECASAPLWFSSPCSPPLWPTPLKNPSWFEESLSLPPPELCKFPARSLFHINVSMAPTRTFVLGKILSLSLRSDLAQVDLSLKFSSSGNKMLKPPVLPDPPDIPRSSFHSASSLKSPSAELDGQRFCPHPGSLFQLRYGNDGFPIDLWVRFVASLPDFAETHLPFAVMLLCPRYSFSRLDLSIIMFVVASRLFLKEHINLFEGYYFQIFPAKARQVSSQWERSLSPPSSVKEIHFPLSPISSQWERSIPPPSSVKEKHLPPPLTPSRVDLDPAFESRTLLDLICIVSKLFLRNRVHSKSMEM
ncbi:unnamed protein product [Cochlearia groenlandica]